ncbi:programmed cell death protein 2-like isoform X2 [Tachypleus tridentatus]|uniref:programmed cell death protein 2-like isoform X2 n=1 Tax=Tachypleus tridentatus TaxID=6853 RepID=UPI003FCF7562
MAENTISDNEIKEDFCDQAIKCQLVELGFIEHSESSYLSSCFFPSKIGGKPAWLSLTDIPSSSMLRCNVCNEPFVFLQQVYAPLNEKESAFHRMIFIFVCKNPKCCSKNSNLNFKVFRCQLPRKNKFYDYDPPNETKENLKKWSVDKFLILCDVCGCLGDKRCGRCHKKNYCSKEHQILDWKSGHREHCGCSNHTNFLLPEFELVMEHEKYSEEKEEKTESQKLEEYQKFLTSPKADDLVKDSKLFESELEALALKSDKMYNKFKKRIANEPEQVLRYHRGGQPLWISSENIPKAGDIPFCPCGVPRQFEFQVMPQLLNYLNMDELEDSVDWGTLVVYTCSVSCEEGPVYHPEFLWKQDFSNYE